MSFGVPDFKIPENIRWEPRQPEEITVSTADLRPCTVDKMKALFHRWEDKSWIVPPSPMVGGHPGGEVRGVFAIVEMEDGSVREVEPTQVNFGDNHRLFEQYAFGNFESEECHEDPVLDCLKDAPILLWKVERSVTKWSEQVKCTCPVCNHTVEAAEPPEICPICLRSMDGYFDIGSPAAAHIFPSSEVYK